MVYYRGQQLYIDLNWMGTISNALVTFIEYIGTPSENQNCTVLYDGVTASVNSKNLRVYK